MKVPFCGKAVLKLSQEDVVQISSRFTIEMLTNFGSSVIFEYFLDPYSRRKGGRGLGQIRIRKKFDWHTKVCTYIVMRGAVTSHDGYVLLRENRSELSFSKRSFYF